MKRREFITKSSIASVGLSMALVSCEQKIAAISIPESDRIRIGIIGMGDRGSAIIKVLNASPIFKVVACCDNLQFRLKKGVENINAINTTKIIFFITPSR